MTGKSLFLEVEAGPSGPVTTHCPVRLGLEDGRVLDVELFLLSDATRPGGVTSVEATIDGEREFIPIRIQDRDALVRRDAIRYVEVPADAPGTVEMLDAVGSFDVVTLNLDSGEVFSGVLRFPAPADSMRMSDVFNKSGRFLPLATGDRLILVAKAHLVEASF